MTFDQYNMGYLRALRDLLTEVEKDMSIVKMIGYYITLDDLKVIVKNLRKRIKPT